MTRRHRFAPPLFLVLALLVALGLFTPQPVGAIDPRITDSTTIYTPFGGASGGGTARITDMLTFCPGVSDVTKAVTETTATFTFTTLCPSRAMLIINREVNPAPFGDGQIVEQTDGTHHVFTLRNLSPATGYRYRLLIVPNGGGSATEFESGRFETRNAQLTRLTVTEAGFSEFGPLTRFDLQTSNAADTKIVLWAYGVQTRYINVPNAAQGASLTVQSQEDCRTYAYQITVNGQIAKQGTFQTNRPNYGCHDAIPFPSANPNP